MKLENLIKEYQRSKSDDLFATIYRSIEESVRFNQPQYESTVAKSLKATIHETRELFDDCVMYTISNYDNERSFIAYFKWKFRNMRANFIRDKRVIDSTEVYETNTDDTAMSSIEMVDKLNLEEYVIAKKEADQLALIDFLLKDADELTIGVVKTFLKHPKPTPTAIGKRLGLHHSTVIRKLEKLASKFDSKQYGSHRDYLVAL
ncbi:hypothetical protein [Niallia circulans]|uniref:hypothetical protein n=1 Tax=Niallia circulans TaxID=1397 RepID=UPI0015612951|nr:hypothetical protein [Niallia circulans]NRG30749.1 hypothetical protein [Niallia circulans]